MFDKIHSEITEQHWVKSIMELNSNNRKYSYPLFLLFFTCLFLHLLWALYFSGTLTNFSYVTFLSNSLKKIHVTYYMLWLDLHFPWHSDEFFLSDLDCMDDVWPTLFQIIHAGLALALQLLHPHSPLCWCISTCRSILLTNTAPLEFVQPFLMAYSQRVLSKLKRFRW